MRGFYTEKLQHLPRKGVFLVDDRYLLSPLCSYCYCSISILPAENGFMSVHPWLLSGPANSSRINPSKELNAKCITILLDLGLRGELGTGFCGVGN
jgi:hypothetical protein